MQVVPETVLTLFKCYLQAVAEHLAVARPPYDKACQQYHHKGKRACTHNHLAPEDCPITGIAVHEPTVQAKDCLKERQALILANNLTSILVYINRRFLRL